MNDKYVELVIPVAISALIAGVYFVMVSSMSEEFQKGYPHPLLVFVFWAILLCVVVIFPYDKIKNLFHKKKK